MTKVDMEDIKKEATEEEIPEDKKADSEEAEQPEEAQEEKKSEEKEAAEEDSDTRYLRLMADFQNYKKRVEKEKTDIYSYANEKLITEILDIVDNFERALQQEEIGDGFKEGMEMIFKQLRCV